MVLLAQTEPRPGREARFLLEDENGLLVQCATGIVFEFAGLALPLHQKLESRTLPPSIADIPGSIGHEQERIRLLQKQAHDIAALGAWEVARTIRDLPPIHSPYIKWSTLHEYAQFALEQAEAGPLISHKHLRDLETFAEEIKLFGYSSDILSSPQNSSLVNRLDFYQGNSTRGPQFFEPDSALTDMFFPVVQRWFDSAAAGAPLGLW